MPNEPGEISSPETNCFLLPCGAEKTNLKTGWYSISDGAFHPGVPEGITFSPEVGNKNSWFSGEALIFPFNKGTILIVGRNSELKIDTDLVTSTSMIEQLSSEGATEYVTLLKKVDAVSRLLSGAESLRVSDFGDIGISRHHLQISNHPEGVTVVSYDFALGIKPEQYNQPKSERFGFPTILRQYSEKPVTHRLNWTTFRGSSTLGDGDVVIIDGEKRKYCLRFFSAREGKPPMFVKQIYPLDTTLEELHKELIVPYNNQEKPVSTPQ